ncbi:SMR family transporter [Jeotgalibacillus marinus]|uniref:SMR family transporter n=1 Tax=Jeotgalibacillus marinus TaxID=86667 RepID=A0ABV3Q6T1_9BACL
MYEAIEGFSRGTFTPLTVVNGASSFYLLALIRYSSMRQATQWTGVGAAESVLEGMFFFKESRDRKHV